MSDQLQDSLENLRFRATCSICTELYTTPKKLPNCSHVFCLTCVKRYLQSKLPNNFPPCPMCRKPITKTIKQADSLEPARAEEDIVDFVRPLETCDLCQKKGRPTVKCIECSYLICENCESAHSKLQPLHSVVSIFEFNVVNQLRIKNECKTHAGQRLDMYCLMCCKIMCMYCDKYSHESCIKTYAEINTYLQKVNNSPDLLQQFIYSNEERKMQIRNLDKEVSLRRLEANAKRHLSFNLRPVVPNNLPAATAQILQTFPQYTTSTNKHLSTPIALRVVSVKEISEFARQYLRNLKTEVEKDLYFYREYMGKLSTLQDEDVLKQRGKLFSNLIGPIVQKGAAIASRVDYLIDRSSDLDIAESALTCERDCILFFRYRKPYASKSSPPKLTLLKEQNRQSVKQTTSCSVIEHCDTNALLFVAKVALSECTNLHKLTTTESSKISVICNTPATEKITDSQRTTCLENNSDEIINSIKCFSFDKDEFDRFRTNIVDNSQYTNTYLEKANIIDKQGVVSKVLTVSAGFVGSNFTNVIQKRCIRSCSYNSKTSSVEITKETTSSLLRYQTCFQSLLSAVPFVHENNQIRRQEKETASPVLVCLIGTSGSESGLEALFLECKEENGFVCGIMFQAKLVRFKQTTFTDVMKPSEFSVLTDKDKMFYFIDVQSHQGNALMTYRSKKGELRNGRNFFCISDDESKTQVPISAFTVDLLCEMKTGIFFAKHEDGNDKMIVGTVKMTRIIKDEDVLYSITQADIAIPLGRIIPVTMAETRNDELVIVCTVEDDVTTLVVILPMKQSIEMLTLEYISFECDNSFIRDLEMDADGNIMFILEKNNNKHWRVMTKYIMP